MNERDSVKPSPIDLSAVLGIQVEQGFVPDDLEGGVWHWPWLCTSNQVALSVHPSGLRVLVRDGNHITVSVPAEIVSSGQDPRWIVEGQGVWLAMLQRGTPCMHAAILEVNGAVIAVSGDSGAGKSTTALGLAARGHQLLVDDVAVLETHEGHVSVLPFDRGIHLTEASALQLGINFEEHSLLAGGRGKVSIRPSDTRASDPRELTSCYFLVPDPEAGELRSERVFGAKKLEYLHRAVGWGGLAGQLIGRDRYFQQLLLLSESIAVTVIERPTHSWSLNEIQDLIEQPR